jgi:hypothetical protein
MAEAKSTTAKTAPDVAPISPGGLQYGEKVGTPLTTNPPRGVDEAPSTQIADEPAAAALQKHVQDRVDAETKQGYRGDANKNRTPNSAYTLAGVNRGDATPETTVHTPSSK